MKYGRFRLASALVLAMMLALVGTPAYAQGTVTSTLTGTVTDASGGVIRVLSASLHEFDLPILVVSVHQPMRARRTDGRHHTDDPDVVQTRRNTPPYRTVA